MSSQETKEIDINKGYRVIHAGHLNKPARLVQQRWHMRFFILAKDQLNQPYLLYFKDEKEAKVLGNALCGHPRGKFMLQLLSLGDSFFLLFFFSLSLSFFMSYNF